MLRASAATSGQQLDLRAIADPTIDLRIPAGAELLEFTSALINDAGLSEARSRLVVAIGEDGAARAALTAANFEMMNRIVNATGVPVPSSMTEVFVELGLTFSTERE